ncbi:MAG: hypothetical protein KDH96_03505 [Candidatus Riesia sp.]|nr:hypothetical protein [Candidatus Riesia sp.]
MHPAGLILPKQVASGASLYDGSLFLHLDAGDSSSYPGSGSTWYDLTSNAYDFSLTNTTYNGTYGAISFTGTNSYAFRTNQVSTIFNFQNLTNGDISFEFWANLDSSTSIQDTISSLGFAYGSAGTTYWQWRVFHSYGTVGSYTGSYYQVNFIQSNTVNYGKLIQNTDPNYTSSQSASTWYHFFVTFDISTQTITWYQNGVDVGGTYTGTGCTSYRSVNTSWDDLGVGASDNNGSKYYSFDGDIAVFRMYDECVGATDVAGNFDYYKARFGY